MERISRDNFVKNTNAKLFVYNKFIETYNLLKDSELVKKYDGKAVNKKFTNKVNPTLPKGMKIEIKDDWNGYAIHLYFDRYGVDSEALKAIDDIELRKAVNNLSYDTCCDKLYPTIDKKYITSDRVFNVAQFNKDIEDRIKILEDWVNDYQRGIDEVELTYQKYVDLEKHVEEVMKSVPQCLRKYINIQNPLF